MKKSMLLLLCMAAAVISLNGCSISNVGTVNPTTAPTTARPTATASPTSMMPMTTDSMMSPMASASPDGMSPSANMATAGGAGAADTMTPAEAGRLAERISESIERMNEIDDAEVVVSDGRVLVAVEFDDQYSMGLDDRMKKMIAEKVKEIDSNLTRVEITDDDTLYGQVKGLGERVAKATGLDELADDFGDLWDRITGTGGNG